MFPRVKGFRETTAIPKKISPRTLTQWHRASPVRRSVRMEREVRVVVISRVNTRQLRRLFQANRSGSVALAMTTIPGEGGTISTGRSSNVLEVARIVRGLRRADAIRRSWEVCIGPHVQRRDVTCSQPIISEGG
jgi:hypothetical protein